eukprot:TRINITY_DN10846_c0_g1_i1.p1 TRINITY_DN10846_c0_g1~~TRINITY_DN10846_c0_g1_i1.p1  ORF type:complete len:347 (+),score=63.51 TRINITY_DN10846_c0_g1_i1:180-1220(+)
MGTELLAPSLKRLVDPLVARGLAVRNPRPGNFSGGPNTRCSLQVPLACNWLQWELIFADASGSTPPDFQLHQDCDMTVDLAQLASISRYNQDDPNAVDAIVQELREQMQKHELSKAAQFPNERLQFELQTVAEWPGMQLCSRLDTAQIHFAFTVNAEDGTDLATLQFVYGIDSTAPPTVQLHWSTPTPPKFQLPAWTRDDCLVEYILRVQAQLYQAQQALLAVIQQRTALFDAARQAFGCALEAGSDRISFQFVHSTGFCVICHFVIHPNFPAQMPEIVLQSLYPSRGGQPLTQTFKEYPYSPRWPPEELCERWRAFLMDKIPAFKAAHMPGPSPAGAPGAGHIPL